MSGERLHLDVAVLTAPLASARPVEALGPALWLYLALVVAANHRGTAIRTRMRLAGELSVPEATIDEWLERLVKARLIEVNAPSPYLVISLRFWSGGQAMPQANSAESSGGGDSPRKDVPVSSQQQLAAADENNGDGGPGEGAALLTEARSVLGDGDTDEIAMLISRHPARIVRRALQRVRATPSQQIRRSKLALFRFLLVHFSTHS